MATAEHAPGSARSRGVSVHETYAREAETQPVPDVLLEQSYEWMGHQDLAVERYTSYDFHRREVEKVWRKVWQMACREDDIPNVGDHIVYDIAEHSILVVRSAPDTISAYHNSCLHRGRQLRHQGGNVPVLRCPFHGWTWNLDGTLRDVPSQWDFPHVEAPKFCLPKVHTATWAGFVFVNMDEDPVPFDEYIGVLPQHFARWRLEDRAKVAHVAGVVSCNWKVLIEAFVEGYHGTFTHPQMAFYVGDENTQYDFYGDNISRMITLEGVPSPNLRVPIDEDTIAQSLVRDLGVGDPSQIKVPEGMTARQYIALLMREQTKATTGFDLSEYSDGEVLDAIEYCLFPNVTPWGGFQPMVYRVRPNGDDQGSSIIDIMMLMPVPEGAPKPPAAPMRVLEGIDPDWRQAPELGALGHVFNQDMQNLPYVQRGLRAAKKRTVTLSNYQEIRLRHYHATLDKYLEA